MAFYNIVSCQGWSSDAIASWAGSAPCIKSRLGLIFMFFIIAMVRKWGAEELGVGFSFLMSVVGGVGAYLLIVTIFGSFKLALLIGLGAGLIMGYGFGIWFGGEEY